MSEQCKRAPCTGTIEDGFCDTCGLAAKSPGLASAPLPSPVGASFAGSATTKAVRTAKVGGYSGNAATNARRPTPTSKMSGTTGTVASSASGRTSKTSSTRRGGSRGSSSRRRSLGGGLVQMPVVPSSDPLLRVRSDLLVSCPACRAKINPAKRFCGSCGHEHSLKPMLAPGDTVAGQYEIKGTMAFGGLGWIYLGMDVKLNRWVVLKGLLNSKDEASAAAAVAERQFLAAVKHGKIVGIYNFVVHGAESYIVMEYVDGRTLKEIRKEQGPMPPEEAISYILGILPAFGYLFAQNLVYCDFKPDNFMLEGDDVKLIDMGGVRRVADLEGDVYGTKGFMAAEAGDDPSPSSDLYSITRTLMALMMDFDITGEFEASVPPPNELLYTVPKGPVEAAFKQALEAAAGIAAPIPPTDPFDGAAQPTADEVEHHEKAVADYAIALADYKRNSAGFEATAKLRAGNALYSASLPNGAPLPGWLAFDASARTFTGTAPADVVEVPVTVVVTPEGAGAVALAIVLRLPLADCEDLYRFVIKGTATEADGRFQTAEEMAGQLLGVLRGIVARRGPIPVIESEVFVPERAAKPGVTGPLSLAWRHLPAIKIDQNDIAASDVFGAAGVAMAAARLELLKQASKAKPRSIEALLRIADLLIEQGQEGIDAVMPYLDEAVALNPFDWRPDWYCGKLYLSLGRATEALACFDKVYGEIPGEVAPKLALAVALEAEGRLVEAEGLYDRVQRQDPSLQLAPFGLARCRLGLDDKPGAIEALGRVSSGSPLYCEAQLLIARTLTGGPARPASLADLAAASDILVNMTVDDVACREARVDLVLEAVRLLEGGTLGSVDGEQLLGVPARVRDLRFQAERDLRACARLVEDRFSAVGYVDRANAVRPRTLL